MKNTKRVSRTRRRISVPKECYFCKPSTDAVRGKEKIQPSFWDTQALQRFLTERGKIIPAARNGLCAKHQRATTYNIKYARHLALLPFISKG
jgi:small subunit ribosomal protein S18